MRWLLLSAVLFAGPARADGTPAPAVREKLSARIKETLPAPVAVKGAAQPETGEDEPVLELPPMVITGAMETELLAEARRAAEARKARGFSLLRGGTLFSSAHTDIGFWPQLVPIDDTPVKKGGVGIRVDLLRIKW